MNDTPYRDGAGDSIPVGTRKWKENIDASGVWGEHPAATTNIPAVDAWRKHIWDAMASDREVYFSGGNHLASKFYQAKWAIDYVVSNLDNVSFGFATGMQERIPRVCALYRKMGTNEFTWIARYGEWRYKADHDANTPGFIDRTTYKVLPWSNVTAASAFDPQGDFIPFNFTISAGETAYTPLVTNGTFGPGAKDFPSAQSGIWSLGTQPTTVTIDGKQVKVTPLQFDYYAIRYSNTTGTPSAKHPHSWSYVHEVPDELYQDPDNFSWPNRQWDAQYRRDPYFPDDQDSDDYLGAADLTTLKMTATTTSSSFIFPILIGMTM